ncbi:hypothetical protein [Macrococcus capreoli]|uniref:hypothetical protein n=1 Tax=Macrococcus capreoli TaxID=2982690 RepID=UPI003EE67DFC
MKKGLMNIHIITTNNIKGEMFQKNDINLYKVATYIKLARQSGHVILLNNGQFLTGSAISAYYAALKEYKRIPLITMMNMLKYDATNISAHDFSLGLPYFSRAHAMSEFPFLSCNILNRSTKEPYFNTPYIIQEYKGIKIGVIALSEAGIVNDGDLLTAPTLQSIKTWVRYMYDKESPDFVIALHNGEMQSLCESDMTLCTEGIHMMLSTCSECHDVAHDLTEMVYLPDEPSVLHIQLTFKERTNSFELKGSKVEFVDTSRYQEDVLLQEALYYEEKAFKRNIQPS